MKKYFRFLITFLVVIGVLAINSNAHAMTTEDFAGRVYKITSKTRGEDSSGTLRDMNWDDPYYVFINNKGEFVRVDDQSALDKNDSYDRKEIKKIQKTIKQLTSSKKKANKIFKKNGDEYSINGNQIKGLVSEGTLISEDPNHLTVSSVIENEKLKYLTVNGATSINVTYDLVPADQSMQYKFEW